MAIAFTNVLANGSATDTTTTHTTGSFSVVAGRLYLVGLFHWDAGGAGTTPTSVTSSGGETVDSLGTNSGFTIRASGWRFRALATTTITLTFNYSGGRAIARAAWIVDEVTGEDTSGTNGSGAIVQAGSATGTTTNPVVTLASAPSSASNETWGAYGGNVSQAGVAPSATWTQIIETPQIESALTGASLHKINSQTASWATSNAANARIAVEVKATGLTAVNADLDLRWFVERDVFYFPTGSLTAWETAKEDAGTRVLNGVAWGDSVPQGCYSSHYHDMSWPGQLATLLQADLGDGGSGFHSVRNATGVGATGATYITVSGAWTTFNQGVNETLLLNNSAGVGSVTFPGVRGSVIDVYVNRDDTAAQSYTITVDGGTPVTQSVPAGVDQIQKFSHNVSAGTHSVVIAPSSGGFVLLCGIGGRNATGFAYHNMGMAGRPSSAGQTTTGLASGNSGTVSVTDFAPDIVFITAGGNDIPGAVTKATYKANLERLVALAPGTASVVLVLSHLGSVTDPSNRYQQYEEATYEVALAEGCAVYNAWADGDKDWGVWDALDFWGITDSATGDPGTDPVHPSDEGHGHMAAQLYTFLGEALTAVGDNLDARWSVLDAVSDSADVRWAVRTTAGDTADVRWAAHALATDDLDARWAVRAAVGDETSVQWTVRALASDTTNIQWAILAVVNDDLDARWGVRTFVGDTADFRWALAALAGDTVDTRWAVRALASDDSDLRWSVRSAVSDALELVWNVLAIGSVGDTLALRWATRALAADDLDTPWAVRTTLGDSLDTRWALHDLAGDSTDLRWQTRQAVADSADLRWGVHALASDALDVRWQVHIGAGNTVVFQWTVRSGAGDALGIVWAVLAPVGDNLDLRWRFSEFVFVGPIRTTNRTTVLTSDRSTLLTTNKNAPVLTTDRS